MARDILKFAEDYTVATDDVSIILGEPMREHTSFHIGGSADALVQPYTAEALGIGISLCRREELPYWVLGKGTNVLVGDRGMAGVVFDMTKMTGLTVEGCTITAEAGVLLSVLSHAALEHSLTGLEFASGIPGSVGGGIFMNAGAFGGEMAQVLTSARIMTEYGEIREISAAELGFGYRSSKVEEKKWIVLEGTFTLTEGDAAAIEAAMNDWNEKRRTKQPLDYPSAGSTFKRPEGYFAGKLIQDAGLAGYQVGGAQVSEKHCGFVINKDHASAKDVLNLCNDVIAKVKEQFGVELEPEIRKLGDF